MFGLNLLGFFTSKAGLTLIAAALVVGVIGVQTVRLDHAKGDLKALRQAEAAAKLDLARHEQAAAQITTDARNTLSQRQAQIIVRYRTLKARLPDVAKNDADCRIGDPFVELWNLGSGNAGEVPGPAGSGQGPSPPGSLHPG